MDSVKNSIENEIEIGWPLKALFHYMSDPETHPQWRSRVLHASWLEGEKNLPGKNLLVVHDVMGKSIPVKMEVIQTMPYQQREYMRDSNSYRSFYSMKYQARGECTRITLSVRCEPKRKISIRHLTERMAESSFNELLQLKRILESEK